MLNDFLESSIEISHSDKLNALWYNTFLICAATSFSWKIDTTRKSCSERNTKTALCYRSTIILKLWYMMAMWSMKKQKFIDQLSCKIWMIVKKNNNKEKMADWQPFWIF